MKRYRKALTNLAIAAAAVFAALFVLPRAIVFFMPFVVGWVIAMIASPLVYFFEEKIKLKRKLGSAFVIIVVIGLVVLLLYILGAWLVEQIGGLAASLPQMWKGMEADLNRMGERLQGLLQRLPSEMQEQIDVLTGQIGASLGAFFSHVGTPTIAAAGRVASRLPNILIGTMMALLSSYFFVAEHRQINEWFRRHTPAALQLYYGMIRRSLARSVGGYFKAQLKIEVWMYLLLVIGLGALGVGYYALIALGIAILDFIPVLGTGTVLIPWAAIKIFAGDYRTAVGLLIIWCVGQLVRQLIQPKIVGDSMGVAPLPTLILLYAGYQIGGVAGMIVAVPLGLLLYTMAQEGVFDSVKNSVLILVAGVNRFRRLGTDDLFEVKEMAMRNQEITAQVEAQREESQRQKEAEKAAQKEARQQRKQARKNKKNHKK